MTETKSVYRYITQAGLVEIRRHVAEAMADPKNGNLAELQPTVLLALLQEFDAARQRIAELAAILNRMALSEVCQPQEGAEG